MVVLLRSLFAISILFFSASSLYARNVSIDDSNLSLQNDKVAFLFGIFGSKENSTEDVVVEEAQEENTFSIGEDSIEDVEQNLEPEDVIDINSSVDNTLGEKELEKPAKVKNKNRGKEKSLRGKSYYISLAYSQLLIGNSNVNYFSMELSDPNDDTSPLLPVYTDDVAKLARTGKVAVALGKYYSSIDSSIEFEYSQFYVRSSDFNGGSIYTTDDDRLYRTWTSGMMLWKWDIFGASVFGSSPITLYSILGGGFVYTTLSKKETNVLQLAYTAGGGLSWRLNSTITIFGDLRYNSNVSSLETFSQGYDQRHSVDFVDLNLGLRFYTF